MSKYDVELRERQEIIVIAEILQRHEEHSVGFPAIEVVDAKGRKHLLTAVDFPSFEFEAIEVGSRLELRIQERITLVKVMGQAESTREGCSTDEKAAFRAWAGQKE